MLKSYLLTTLLSLSQVEQRQGRIILTTTELAKRLDTSQQTASRYLIELEKRGFILRRKSRMGEEITITTKGLQELSPLYLSLKKIFEPRLRELILTGEIVSGLGEGAYYVSKSGYKLQFEKKLGFTPFPGTLNVKISNHELKESSLLAIFEPIMIEGFSDGERSFGSVKCYRAILNNSIRCFVVTALRTHYKQNILEIISESDLRKRLGLKDGDRVTVKVY